MAKNPIHCSFQIIALYQLKCTHADAFNLTVACRAAIACDLVNPMLSIMLILGLSHEPLDTSLVTMNGAAKSTNKKMYAYSSSW